MKGTISPSMDEGLEDSIFLVLCTALAMMMRVYLFPIESGDYLQFLHPWYETLKENGFDAQFQDGHGLHDWAYWDTCIKDFLEKIAQERAARG